MLTAAQPGSAQLARQRLPTPMSATNGMAYAGLYVLSGITTASIEQFLLLEGASGA